MKANTMKIYTVLDNGKPADSKSHRVHWSWEQAEYPTKEEAYEYALKWFYPYGQCSLEDYLRGFDYSNLGDIAQIVESEAQEKSMR